MAILRDMVDYDLELEEKVLGVFLMEPPAYSLVLSILREECFYGIKTKEIYKAIKSVYENGYGIDYLVVQRHFYNQGITKIEESNISYIITNMQMGVVSSAHIVSWCLILRDLAAQRLMRQLKNSGELQGDAFEEAKKIEDQIKDIMDIKVVDDWVHISDVATKLQKHMIEAAERKGIIGISTSIAEIDELNGGFRETQLIVIGARPSVGKSAFMGRIATHAAFTGKSVGIISLEMEDKDILARSVASDADVSFWRIDRSRFEEEEMQRLRVQQAISSLAKLPIYYSDTAQVNLMDIRAKVERLKQKHGVDLLIIDYLQLVEPENINFRNREQEVSKICRGLKLLAMNMKMPIIILAQLNRQSEEKGDKKPQLHHLRESGSIEQDADVVMFIHSDFQSGIEQDKDGRTTEDRADLLVRKWRNGAKCEVKLGFDGPKMKFFELSSGPVKKEEGKQMPLNKPNAGFENRRLPTPPEKDEEIPF